MLWTYRSHFGELTGYETYGSILNLTFKFRLEIPLSGLLVNFNDTAHIWYHLKILHLKLPHLTQREARQCSRALRLMGLEERL